MRAWPCLALAFTVVTLLAVPAGSAGLGVSPKGKIAFVRFSEQVGQPEVYVADAAGHSLRRLPLRVPAADGPAWSPDGRRLAFIGGSNAPGEARVTLADDLYLARANGASARRLTHDAAHEAGPVWAPDGTRIALVRSPQSAPNRSSIFIVSVSSGRLRRLTYGNVDLQPSWSADGRLIAFLRIDSRTRQAGVWVVRPDGSHLRRILASLRNVTDPVWSPVATRLLLSDGRRLLTVAPDGSGQRTVARLSADSKGARTDPEVGWSPDGKMVVFAQLRSGTEGRSDIWLVRSDGSGLRRLTVSPGLDFSPDWSD